ncbi:MAG TPA: PIG-L family deacetylase [Bryobacteraceae bacterium]|nr:PIG-L family deacetylase [Bryobacteraceae bacterium]
MKRLLTIGASAGILSLAFLAAVAGHVRVLAQNRMSFPLVSQDSGHVALGLALRKLGVSGTFMQIAAHPDDEHNALYALYTHGMGLRSIDVQTTRGDGGQNEIGPELFRDMAVLRTSELLSAHRLDGAEQYFARAIDYGYSFDPEEVIQKWGRQETVGDFVRLIRTLRPEVLVTMNIQGRGGDRAHEAAAILAREAFRAAGDPSKFPEQIREGLRPWQPRKLYFSGGPGGPGGGRGGPGGADGRGAPGAPGAGGGRAGAGRGGRGGRGAAAAGSAPAPTTAQAANAAPAAPPAKMARPNTAMYDTLLGRTYAEIGSDARSNHKCQGMGGPPPLPGVGGGRGGGGGAYQLVDSTIAGLMDKDETSLFDGLDISLSALAQFAAPDPPEALASGLASIADAARRAQSAFAAGNDAGAAAPVESGLGALRALRAQLASLPISEEARYEIDFRLKIKERDYQDAVLAAHGVTFDAVADDGLVIGGQPVKLSMVAVNRGASEVGVTGVAIAGFDAPGNCAPGPVKKDGVFTCTVDAHVPEDARLTTPYFTDDYWSHPANPAINSFEPDVPFGVPFRPTPYRVTFLVKAGDAEVTRELPFQFRYMKDTYLGDKRMELNVVPAFSVRVTPPLAVIPAGAGGAAKAAEREIHVTVTNGTKGAAQATVALELPAGWKAAPASVPVSFAHEDESLSARFVVTAPPQVKTGGYTVRAVVTSPATGSEKFANGYQEIEYPHIQRRQVIKPAETAINVVDVKIIPNISAGYIAGVGDQVPPAIEQLGARLSFIGQDELAWGDLSKYDVIVTGVRAYERRADLRAYNRRLLDYVERGGTVIVQYNKMEFNQAQYGPYPARVSGNRVSDETVPVKVLAPAHPVFNYPNKIGAATWAGWVQERGLYFLGEKDAKYVDLVSMVDSYKDNPGDKLGSLVEGKFGKGRWIYVGLGLWRQLPAGTDGAYQLLANLISLGKAPAAARAGVSAAGGR